MGEEQGFIEYRALVADAHRERDAAQGTERRAVVLAEGQRHETGAEIGQPQTELPGDAVAEVARAEFREGQSAGGHDERRGGEFPRAGAHAERTGSGHLLHLHAAADLNVGAGAFGEEKIDDFPRSCVAEELPEFFLVPGDAPAFDQREEIGRRVAGQRGAAEVAVG